MNPNEAADGQNEWNRRDFLRGTSFGTMMMMMGAIPLEAQEAKPAADESTHYSTKCPPVPCGLIGCGLWGREILQTLALDSSAPVAGLCDTFKGTFRKAKELAPNAQTYTDYRQLLDQKDVKAVIVATPTHLHKEIVIAALQAGKHVYCEAPLATTVEDARAIAQAAAAAELKVNFQSGLQARSDKQTQFVLAFIRNGALGKNIVARGQWRKKNSLRRTHADPEREKALNWQLYNQTSGGLISEIGIHQLDLISWMLNQRPAAVAGFGGTLFWNKDKDNDDRDVADSIQTVFEYPSGVNYLYDCTLANSFDGQYDVIYGSGGAIMMRGSKAWLFKEADADQLGWEVYARHEKFYEETGIALVAGASKSVKQAAGEAPPQATSQLHFSLNAFIRNSNETAVNLEDFTTNFPDSKDPQELRDYQASKAKSRLPAAGYREGFEATVLAIKANEAIRKGQKIVLSKEWFEV